MSKIVAGDLVTCIKPGLYLTLGKTYKVTKICEDEEFVHIEGFGQSFYASRFSKIVKKKTREEWIAEFKVMTSADIVDSLIKEGSIEVRQETPEEVFTKTAVGTYGYMPRGTGGYLDEVFDMLEECNIELKFKDEK